MSLLKIKLAQLHTPIFVSGTNLSDKLNPESRGGLSLMYDRTEKELLVTYKEQTAIVPSTNIVSMIPVEAMHTFDEPIVEEKPVIIRVTKSAQVGSPTDHVFGGLGAGKTGRD